MNLEPPGGATCGMLLDTPALRGRARVYRDRAHAGDVLAGLLQDHRNPETLLLAIPAGGVPVALEISCHLRVPVEIAATSRIVVPGRDDVAFGAVAFDGTSHLDRARAARLGLDDESIRDAVAAATRRVRDRQRRLCGDRPPTDLARRDIVVVDDGAITGFTARVVLEALRRAGAAHVLLALGTAPRVIAEALAAACEVVICPNLRDAEGFRIDDAYESWPKLQDEDLRLPASGPPATARRPS